MQTIAIYDLDKTILTKPTFTAFLMFAAGQKSRILWWRMIIWIAALIGYKLKLYGRKPMKQFGLSLFVGAEIPKGLAEKFAKSLIPSGVQHGAERAIAADKAAGKMLVIASAAPEFYVHEMAKLLNFDAVIATQHLLTNSGAYLSQFAGKNCYGGEKLTRAQAWLAENGLDRKACHIRFYSDHPSDAPVFDWADEAVLITASRGMHTLAKQRGWKSDNWR
jgi:phosphatidylglycerophosphatase C